MGGWRRRRRHTSVQNRVWQPPRASWVPHASPGGRIDTRGRAGFGKEAKKSAAGALGAVASAATAQAAFGRRAAMAGTSLTTTRARSAPEWMLARTNRGVGKTPRASRGARSDSRYSRRVAYDAACCAMSRPMLREELASRRFEGAAERPADNGHHLARAQNAMPDRSQRSRPGQTWRRRTSRSGGRALGARASMLYRKTCVI